MLDAAIETVSEGEEQPIVHSDRGAHYRWPSWLTRTSEAKLVRSMSREGYSQDNAACEGFFGRLKTELLYPRDWKTITIEQFIAEVDAYIRSYNERRIKISLGSLSPVDPVLQADIHQGAQQSGCTSDAVYMAATDLFTGTDRILDSQEPSIHGLKSGLQGGRERSVRPAISMVCRTLPRVRAGAILV